MKNSIIAFLEENLNSSANEPSKWQQPWRIGLLVSVIVVLILGVVGTVIWYTRAKKLKTKYETDARKKLFAAVNSYSPDFEKVVNVLQTQVSNDKVSDIYAAYLVNTVFINNFSNIYVDDRNDNFFASTIALCCEKTAKNVDFKKYTSEEYKEVKYPSETKNLHLVNDLEKKYDMMVMLNPLTETGLKDITSYVKHLNDRGMLIFLYNRYNKSEVKKIEDFLKENGYQFEKTAVTWLNMLLITYIPKELKEVHTNE